MLEEEHRENVESAFNQIGKQRVKFAHSEMHWAFFLWLIFSKLFWNQHINSEVDKIHYNSIISLYSKTNCPSHSFFFWFCLCFYWTLKEHSSFNFVLLKSWLSSQCGCLLKASKACCFIQFELTCAGCSPGSAGVLGLLLFWAGCCLRLFAVLGRLPSQAGCSPGEQKRTKTHTQCTQHHIKKQTYYKQTQHKQTTNKKQTTTKTKSKQNTMNKNK